MNYIKKFTIIMALFALGCMVQTPLNATNWGSSECSYLKPNSFRDLLGLKKFGLCETYCQVLKCDQLPENPERLIGKIRAKACEKTLENWSKVASGETLPCLSAPAITLSKAVVDADGNVLEVLNVGDPVYYKFTIANTGNVPLGDIILSDGMLPEGELADCDSKLAAAEGGLAVGGSITCQSAGTITAQATGEEGIVNTATVNALSNNGSIPVSAEASATYIALDSGPFVFARVFRNNHSPDKFVDDRIYNDAVDDLYIEVVDTNRDLVLNAGDSIVIYNLPTSLDADNNVTVYSNFGDPITIGITAVSIDGTLWVLDNNELVFIALEQDGNQDFVNDQQGGFRLWDLNNQDQIGIPDELSTLINQDPIPTFSISPSPSSTWLSIEFYTP